MSEEKLYAVKNAKGIYLFVSDDKHYRWREGWREGQVAVTHSQRIAHDLCTQHGGHVVTLVEEPKKVKLPKKAAEWIDSVKNGGYDITYIFTDYAMPNEVSDWLEDSDDEAEHREERGLMLINAYLYGYTVAKEKKYNVKVPHTKDVWYYKESEAYLLTICPTDKKLRGEFTESEIEHYGLQDCEKEEVTDDDD